MNNTVTEIEGLKEDNLEPLESCDVLVVGAGPTGLTLANSLYQQGVKCRIVDGRPGIAKADSKCTTTHIRVLEVFEQLGVLDEVSIEEYFVRGLIFFKPDANQKWKPYMSFMTDFAGTEEVFWKHALSIPQWKLETAMVSALQKKGGDVEYGVKLLHLEQKTDGVIATLYDAQQAKEFKVRCQYLVGCDGVKSTVRDELKIERVGDYYEEFFIIADVYVKNFNYALDRRYTFSGDRYHMHFAHIGDNLFRIFVSYYKEFVNETHQQLWTGNCQENPAASQATLQWFQKQVDDLGLPFQFYDPIRFSSYQVFLGYAKNSRNGRVYLAGDAAHSHTPHGGQGMNTGVMDGHNLGWKLAHTVLGITQDVVLDSYVDERESVWHSLVKKTDFIKDIVERRKFPIVFFTDYIFPLLPKAIVEKISKNTSMLSLNYRKSSISQDDFSNTLIDRLTDSQGVFPGERAPDANVQKLAPDGSTEQTHLHHLLFGDRRLGDYTVLYFNRLDDFESDYLKFKDLIEQCKTSFKAKIAWFYLIPEGSSLFSTSLPILIDVDNTSFKRYGIKNKAIYLIRPDGYVAYRDRSIQPEKIMTYFQKIFTPI